MKEYKDPFTGSKREKGNWQTKKPPNGGRQ